MAPSWEPAKKQGLQSYSHKELDSANNLHDLGGDSSQSLQVRAQLADTLNVAWWDSSREINQGNPDIWPKEMWDNKFVVLSH